MEPDNRAIVHRVVGDYLVSETDVDPEEFEVVFDDVYATLERRMRETPSPELRGDRGGIGFDTSIITDSVIVGACFIAMRLAEAALKAEARRLLSQALDSAAQSLTQWTGRPELVRKIRERVERVVDEL